MIVNFARRKRDLEQNKTHVKMFWTSLTMGLNVCFMNLQYRNLESHLARVNTRDALANCARRKRDLEQNKTHVLDKLNKMSKKCFEQVKQWY